MKRLGLGLAGFWVVLGAVVVVVALNTDDTPAPAEKPPGPMTCASLQKRAQKCADGVSELAGELAAEYLKQEGDSDFAIGLKIPLVGSYVYGAISEKKVATYCKRYWKSKRPSLRRAWANLAVCFKNPGCEAFTRCLGEVARSVDISLFL